MTTSSNNTKFKESEINWDDLEGIGIHKSELDVERLLNGETVNIISLQLTLLGVEIEMDATIQIVEEGNVPMLEICGIKPE